MIDNNSEIGLSKMNNYSNYFFYLVITISIVVILFSFFK